MSLQSPEQQEEVASVVVELVDCCAPDPFQYIQLSVEDAEVVRSVVRCSLLLLRHAEMAMVVC